MAEPILISAFDAAEQLSITAARLRRMAKRQEVPHVVLPDGEIRFRREDLEEWVGRFLITKAEEPAQQRELFEWARRA